MSDKKEEKSSGWWTKGKTLVLAGMMTLFGAHSPAGGAAAVNKSHGVKARTTYVKKATAPRGADKAKTINFSEAKTIAEAKVQVDRLATVTYKGVKLDLRTIKAQDVAHVFESGMNPCITNGNKPISSASYLGLCQLSLNGTMQNYAKSCEKEFPALQQAIKKSGVRSAAFMKAWKTYSYGAKAQEFENSQFSFMWDKVYQNIFDDLHKSGKFPEINLDNYNDPDNIIYTAAVISCANQSPRGTAGIFLQAHQRVGSKAGLNAVALKTYDIKTAKWGQKTRYKQEKSLLEDIIKVQSATRIYNELNSRKQLAQNENDTHELPKLNVREISVKELNSGKLELADATVSVSRHDGTRKAPARRNVAKSEKTLADVKEAQLRALQLKKRNSRA